MVPDNRLQSLVIIRGALAVRRARLLRKSGTAFLATLYAKFSVSFVASSSVWPTGRRRKICCIVFTPNVSQFVLLLLEVKQPPFLFGLMEVSAYLHNVLPFTAPCAEHIETIIVCMVWIRRFFSYLAYITLALWISSPPSMFGFSAGA